MKYGITSSPRSTSPVQPPSPSFWSASEDNASPIRRRARMSNDKMEDVLAGLALDQPGPSRQQAEAPPQQSSDTPGLEVFTPEQLRVIQMLLRSQVLLQATAPPAPAPAPVAPTPAPVRTPGPFAPMIDHRYNAKWPEWDGKTASFPRFFKQLKARAQIESQVVGSSQAIYLSVFMAIPTEQQARVEQWFTDGATHGWDWDAYLGHIHDQFEDKEAIQKAGQKLLTMQMGNHQSFISFLQDFEHQVGLCGGLDWPDRVKIMYLNSAINQTLQVHLTAKNLPNDDYPRWVEKVKTVAGRVEALPGYRSKDTSKTSTWYAKTRGGARFAEVVTPSVANQQTRIDNDGDTMMTGVNALQGRASNNYGQRPRKSRAPWRTPAEIETARSSNACFRCLAKGHRSFECPKFAPARAPARVNRTTIQQAPESMDDVADDLSDDEEKE
ncbi:uncharacterized protein BROUX77_007166 [Berkeleyomyces rouxiae]|uniref:uncharacterized protein n=2 Tax=Berkeleyomyces rouxiae TaxID=2035830 RepID=UPI003B78C040